MDTPASAGSRRLHRPDYAFFLLIAVLAIFGLLMVLSAGSVQSFRLKGNGYYFFSQQLIALAVGLAAFYMCQRIHYSYWKKLATPMMILAVILLAAIFIPGVGYSYGGASRWINLQFTLFQVSEFAKLALVIYLATWFEQKRDQIRNFYDGFVPFVGILGVLAILVMLEPDMGTMSILAGIGLVMFFIAGASLRHIALTAGVAAASVAALIAVAPYRINRFLTFLDPSKDTLGTGYHIQQALVAIGSGGLFGLGFNNSLQKHFFLPEPMNDSIFAIISEELGFFTAAAVIVAFAFLAVRGLRIAKYAPDTFSRLLVTGVITWVVLQAMINIAAMLSLVPLTGVPLPFISLGGSSLVVLMAAMGIVMNVSKYTVKRQEETSERARYRRRNRRSRRAGVGSFGQA